MPKVTFLGIGENSYSRETTYFSHKMVLELQITQIVSKRSKELTVLNPSFSLIYFTIISIWTLNSWGQASPSLSTIQSLKLTPYAFELLESAQPEIINTSYELKTICQKEPMHDDTKTQLLGCYDGKTHRIYLLRKNPLKDKGILESTLAHELLHAVYRNLTYFERDQLNSIFESLLRSKQGTYLQKLLTAYSFSNEQQKYNELHSFIGTEIEDLPEVLEKHYAKYFTDRKIIVDFARYIENKRQQKMSQITEKDLKIQKLKNEIETEMKSLNQLIAEIDRDKIILESLRSQGQIEEHNKLVLLINSKVERLKLLNAARNQKILTLNELINNRNQLAQEINELS